MYLLLVYYFLNSCKWMEIIWSLWHVSVVEREAHKIGEYMKDNIKQLKTNNNNTDVRDLCTYVNEFKGGWEMMSVG
jgi:hypothetical protein